MFPTANKSLTHHPASQRELQGSQNFYVGYFLNLACTRWFLNKSIFLCSPSDKPTNPRTRAKKHYLLCRCNFNFTLYSNRPKRCDALGGKSSTKIEKRKLFWNELKQTEIDCEPCIPIFIFISVIWQMNSVSLTSQPTADATKKSYNCWNKTFNTSGTSWRSNKPTHLLCLTLMHKLTVLHTPSLSVIISHLHIHNQTTLR